MRVSVIIPALNEEKRIGLCIASVHAAFRTQGIPPLQLDNSVLDGESVERPGYEIVVCDNDSTDKTAAVAEAAGARLVHESHRQIALARNRGAAVANGEWLIFLDADSVLSAELLERTLNELRSGKVCAGGALVVFDREKLPLFARFGVGFWNTVSRTFGLAAGSYVFCLRDAWVETGGFDERFYAGEELGFSRRLKQWGRKRDLGFRILTDCPLRTSSRKIDDYTPWQLALQILRLLRPGALRRRDQCSLWYTHREDRQADKADKADKANGPNLPS